MKRKWIPDTDEFFIGYLSEAPEKTSAFLRWVLIALGASVVIIGIVLVKSQRMFSTAEFDYGVYTSIEGHIFKYPVPHLKLRRPDSTGHISFQTILLVGFGKAGADKTLETFQSKLGSVEGKLVKISGQLIHGDDKAILQLAEDRVPEVLQQQTYYHRNTLDVNQFDVTSHIAGEIVDPKCYFGVMKPGEGKPHRSCAIRCIAGGIPPVFRASGTSDYFLLLDEDFRPVNEYVQDIVGDNIELSGKVIHWDDWKILLIKNESLKTHSATSKLMRNLALMEKGITQCGTK